MYAPTSELHLSTELMLNLPRYKGKDSEDKDMQKNLALIAKVLQETLQNIPTTTSVLLPNTRKKNDGLLIKVFNYNAEKSDWLVDTDEEIDEQELEAHYSYMAKIQEVYSDDQNDVECDDECVALANLIANLKLDVDENKKIQKQLKKANATLTQERSLLNLVSWRGSHMIVAITGFWCRLHTHTPEPPSCGLPLHIYVSTRNEGSKRVGNTEGSDIERSDLGGNIGVLGNVTTDIGSCGTLDQVVFLILFFHRRSFDHNTTSVENVGSPGASSSAGHASNDDVIVDDGSGTRSSTSTVQPGIFGLRSSSRIIDGQSVLYTQATGIVVATLTAS
ncbi:hypothetical protein Tco_0015326 [Tanacetum coccineum]